MAIDGIQPTSPQNPPPEFLRKMAMLSGTQTVKSSKPALTSAQKTEDSQQTAADTKGDKNRNAEERASHPRVMQALHVEVILNLASL